MANIFEQLMKGNQEITESQFATPVTRKKIKTSNIKVESRKFLEDANEETVGEIDTQFSVTPEEAEEKEDEVVLIIDPEIGDEEEVPENASEEMVGREVYKCPACGSNYVCNCDSKTESVDLDDNGEPLACPICGDDSDQILIGEIAPVEDAGEEDTLDPVDSDDVEEEETEEEEVDIEDEESLGESAKPSRRRYCDDKKEGCSSKKPPRNRRKKRVKEDFEEDDEFSLELTSPGNCPDCGGNPCECPASEVEEVKEEKKEAPAVEVNADLVNLVLDDKKFESMMTKMIRENYQGTPSFKITRCALRSNGKFVVEYLVKEGKKSSKGQLIGEGLDQNARTMKIRFSDKGVFTEDFARRPSFVVECVKLRSVIIPTKVSYNYNVKVNEQLYKVKGEVTHKN